MFPPSGLFQEILLAALSLIVFVPVCWRFGEMRSVNWKTFYPHDLWMNAFSTSVAFVMPWLIADAFAILVPAHSWAEMIYLALAALFLGVVLLCLLHELVHRRLGDKKIPNKIRYPLDAALMVLFVWFAFRTNTDILHIMVGGGRLK